MKEIYRVEKLEDMPKYVPIIFIKDNGMKNSKPRMFGLDIHDSMVIESNGTQLYYYNLQCGESSHEYSDFRFIKREAVCFDDEFYSHFCQKVDLEKLITDHDQALRKKVCEEIKNTLRKQYPTVYANIGESLFCSDCYLRIRELTEILDQIQGGLDD